MKFTLMSGRARQRRLRRLLQELEGYETAMRDRCAQILELCDPEDDVSVEVSRVLDALDGQS